MPAFLVTGATGAQGGAVARHLLAQKQTVHALVRDPSAPAAEALRGLGARLFKGTFEDVASLKAAAAGTRGIFLNPFPDYAQKRGRSNQVDQTENVIEAARAAGTVDTVVLSTLYGAAKHPEWAAADPHYRMSIFYRPKWDIEQALKAAGFAHVVILRPAWLMQNYLPQAGAHFPELAPERVLAVAADPALTMPHFDSDDLGGFAAAALVSPAEWSGREIELGYEDLTVGEAAAIMSRIGGKEVTVKYNEGGQTNRMVDLFRLWLKANPVEGDPDLEQYGIPLTTLEAYFEREKQDLVEILDGKQGNRSVFSV